MTTTDQGGPLTSRESHVRSYGQNGPRPIRFAHGTTTGYFAAHCRCSACDAVGYRWNKQYGLDRARGVRRLVDAAGSRRRLEALAYVGWSHSHVARELGMGATGLARLGAAANPTVRAASALRLAQVYDRLADAEGPSQWARTHARNRGWQPPLAWDETTIDDPTAKPWQWCTGSAQPVAHLQDAPLVDSKDIDPVVVDRLIHGQHTPATRAEKHAAALHLLERDHTCADVAARIGIAERTAQRLRSRLDVGPREDAADDTHHDREVAS